MSKTTSIKVDTSRFSLGVKLTTLYLSALTIVGSLSLGAHLVLDNVIEDQATTARVINIAANEKMLSQRVALSAMEYMGTSSAESRSRLIAAINSMRGGHQFLISGGRDTLTPFTLTTGVQDIYFGSRYKFDERTRTYLSQADLVAKSQDQAAFDYLKAESNVNMVNLGDKVTQIFEFEAGERIEKLRNLQRIVLVVLLLTLAGEALFIFRPMVKRIVSMAVALYDLAIKDGLTGLLTKRAFQDYAVKALATCVNANIPCSMLVVGIDNLPKADKKLGKNSIATAFKRLADAMSLQMRAGDILARYDTNLFIIMLPSTDLPESTMIAERLRESVGNFDDAACPPFSVSVGISHARTGIERKVPDSVNAITARAIEAFHEAKNSGGNIVMITPNPTPAQDLAFNKRSGKVGMVAAA